MMLRAGDEVLSKILSLKMRKWNSTRWLGRDACLTALCNVYSYVLDHFRVTMNDNSLTKATRAAALDLYTSLTSYKHFMFFFFYKEVTAIMAWTSQAMQRKDLQISDVGRYVLSLCKTLETSFPQDSLYPEELLASSFADSIMRELFNNNLKSMPALMPTVYNY